MDRYLYHFSACYVCDTSAPSSLTQLQTICFFHTDHLFICLAMTQDEIFWQKLRSYFLDRKKKWNFRKKIIDLKQKKMTSYETERNDGIEAIVMLMFSKTCKQRKSSRFLFLFFPHHHHVTRNSRVDLILAKP